MEPLLKYKQGKKVLIFTLIMNTFLAVSKITIGYLYHSQAIIADGIHSASDSFSTIIVMLSLKLASKPADNCHPYGHERSETIATTILALSLIISGIFIVKNNIVSIVSSEFFYPQSINIWAAFISIVIQEVTYRYAVYIGTRIDSQAIIADAKHHRSDALSSVAALIGVIGARNGYPYLDPVAGIIVAAMIIRIGVKILIPVINEIMEKSPANSYINKIKEIILIEEEVKKVTDIKVRKHASSELIEITILVKPGLKVKEAAEIRNNIKNNLNKKIDKHHIREVIIQLNPAKK